MKTTNPLPRVCGTTVLRKLVVSDLSNFQAYRTDPEVAQFQGWEKMTDEEAISFIQHMNKAEFLSPGHWYQIGIGDCVGGYLIGDIGICVDFEEKEAEIGFTLDRKFQKKGLGRESVSEAIDLIFELSEVDRVVGITDKRNQPSIKLLKNVGMKKIKAINSMLRGERCIELVYAIPRK